MNEEWTDIIDYEELYQISNKGNILNKKKDKLMTNTLNIKGYLVVKLSKNNKPKQFKVHQLVGIHYVDNPNNLSFINHKDEIKINNHYLNLEWCDNKYNNTYGTRIERQSKTLKETWRNKKSKF